MQKETKQKESDELAASIPTPLLGGTLDQEATDNIEVMRDKTQWFWLSVGAFSGAIWALTSVAQKARRARERRH